ncbi:GNAT family N-acetyltransferase [Rhizobium metallidurans]|uniref:RimJ/RimL family protein N-acetyltransferase n=1 Tax=Rhizobium metallidurans TaxID=1265931 RepID=A0A7W6GB27_9HYPH|nr:GNAT family N-acetyltransferase [Rhizobium metallidurans]MBB3963221.1 RimJ/RimL family protein N-acetyltransferase [Rhizobium metallidurans]
MSEIIIEPIADRHIESFHHALDTVARERRYLTFLEAPPLESTRDFVRDMIAHGHSQFVATTKGAVVGWCDIRRHSQPVHAHGGALGMGILPSFRGQGLGERLIRVTIDDALAKGLVRIELSVHADNARAIRLYERVGFAREGIGRQAVRIDGRFLDVIAMAFVLYEY